MRNPSILLERADEALVVFSRVDIDERALIVYGNFDDIRRVRANDSFGAERWIGTLKVGEHHVAENDGMAMPAV